MDILNMSNWEIREFVIDMAKKKNIVINMNNISFYITLLNYAKENGHKDEKGLYIDVPMKKIAEIAGFSLSGTPQFLDKLSNLGLIAIERQKKEFRSEKVKRVVRGQYPNRTYFFNIFSA